MTKTCDMTTPSEELKTEIKKLILESLEINDIDPDQIDDEEHLFSGNNTLKLTSVDAIEVIMAIQRHYGFRITDQNLAREVIRSINSIAGFVSEQQNLRDQ